MTGCFTVLRWMCPLRELASCLVCGEELRDIEGLRDNPQLLGRMSKYVAQNTLDSLGSVFSSTQAIQKWLTQCALVVAKICCKPVAWVTPLGLPVVQPYRCRASHSVSAACLGSNQKELAVTYTSYSSSRQKPNVMKQKNAFPANYIHSLDATHMILTSLHCQRAGLTFVSVHDCFWTHPGADTETMNQICRKQFISLHSQPLLEDLSQFFQSHYSYQSNTSEEEDDKVILCVKDEINALFQNIPPKGDFDLNKILDSDFFFS